jgi:hypothetical protein
MRPTAGLVPITLALVAGCLDNPEGAEDRGDRADPVLAERCELAEYGDGVCQPALACSVPDIDCFTFFDGQQHAEAEFARFELLVAQRGNRAPRAIVPTTDPRFVTMRAALDRGWDAYRTTIPVADLALHEPALVLIDDPSRNAFVFGAPNQTANFMVVVHTGSLDVNPTAEALQGLVMHELTHAVNLHVIPGVDERFTRYYVAPEGVEPLGFQAIDDQDARDHGEAWRNTADNVGPFHDPDLGGVPFLGAFEDVFISGLIPLVGNPGCAQPFTLFNQFRNEIGSNIRFIDIGLALPPDAARRARADRVMAEINRCVVAAGVTDDFFDLLGKFLGRNPDDIRNSVSQELRDLVGGKPFTLGIEAFMLEERGFLDLIEGSFVATTGRPFTALRYYSTEENADDRTVPVLRAQELEPTGLAQFFSTLLPAATQQECQALIAAGTVPPYGVDLSDTHHATCWRMDHVARVAASGLLPEPVPQPAPAPETARRKARHGGNGPLVPPLPMKH